MRIIGGEHKGQPIAAPAGRLARPTTDRVREALFNIIEHGARPCEGAQVLDLFAGSGALGLEALSRGARQAVFVEEAAPARGAIRRNVEALGLTGRARILRRDATKLGARLAAFAAPFDLVFCDAPYATGLGALALTAALKGDWIAPHALVIMERSGRDDPDAPEGFGETDRRRYGDTVLAILTVAA